MLLEISIYSSEYNDDHIYYCHSYQEAIDCLTELKERAQAINKIHKLLDDTKIAKYLAEGITKSRCSHCLVNSCDKIDIFGSCQKFVKDPSFDFAF